MQYHFPRFLPAVYESTDVGTRGPTQVRAVCRTVLVMLGTDHVQSSTLRIRVRFSISPSMAHCKSFLPLRTKSNIANPTSRQDRNPCFVNIYNDSFHHSNISFLDSINDNASVIVHSRRSHFSRGARVRTPQNSSSGVAVIKPRLPSPDPNPEHPTCLKGL